MARCAGRLLPPSLASGTTPTFYCVVCGEHHPYRVGPTEQTGEYAWRRELLRYPCPTIERFDSPLADLVEF